MADLKSGVPIDQALVFLKAELEGQVGVKAVSLGDGVIDVYVDPETTVRVPGKAWGWRVVVKDAVMPPALQRRAAWSPKGDGKNVGLFLPIPKELASQFPSLAPRDISPPHVTLLYVGEVPKAREAEFEAIVGRVLAQQPGPIRAQLCGVDSFIQPGAFEQVWYSKVRFSKGVAEIRDRLYGALKNAGFPLKERAPLAWFAHATLGYATGLEALRYKGPVPEGIWQFDSVEVWGLPKSLVLPLGHYGATGVLPTSRVARVDQIPGGIGDRKRPSDFDAAQLRKGIAVEMEHTSDPMVAREIAMDHLSEDPAYYTKLQAVEKHARATRS